MQKLTHSMLFALFFFAHLNKTKGKQGKQNKNVRKKRWQLFSRVDFHFVWFMISNSIRSPNFAHSAHLARTQVRVFFYHYIIWKFMQGAAADSVTHSHSAHRFFDGHRGRRTRGGGIHPANERFFM